MKRLQDNLTDFQQKMEWEITEDSYVQSKESLLLNYMLLTTEIGEIGEELRKLFLLTDQLINQGMNGELAFIKAQEEISEDMGMELADCLAYISKFATFFNRNLERDSYQKMQIIEDRIDKPRLRRE